MKLDLKNIPIIGNYFSAKETSDITKYENITISSNYCEEIKVIDVPNYDLTVPKEKVNVTPLPTPMGISLAETMQNFSIPRNVIPWSIRPYDSLNRDIAINDNIAFVETNYKDNFKGICTGLIVGFTKCFVKIKPDNLNKFYYSYNEFKDGKWQPKKYILKKYNRIIKI